MAREDQEQRLLTCSPGYQNFRYIGQTEPAACMKIEHNIRERLSQLQAEGLYKRERPIRGPQSGTVRIGSGGSERKVINLCANNYLGLANHPEVIAAAKAGLEDRKSVV